MLFKVKFFGTKEYRGQITKQVEYVDAPDKDAVEDILLHQYKYQKVNNLKIREAKDEEIY